MRKTIKKALLLVSLFLLIVFPIQAQISSTVSFDHYVSDSDNDLRKNFKGGYLFNQVSYGGITGGAINIEGNYSYSEEITNRYAVYKDTLNADFSSLESSISFRYIGSSDLYYPPVRLTVQALDPDGYSRSYVKVDVDIISVGDSTHSLNIYSSGCGRVGEMLPRWKELKVGNWYRMSLKIIKGGENIVTLDELGPSGLSAPKTVESVSVWGIGSGFYNSDSKIIIGIIGNKDGGCGYLDNFSLKGSPLSEPTINANNFIEIASVVYDYLPVKTTANFPVDYSIYDLSGKIHDRGTLNSSETINIHNLAPGQYLIAFSAEGAQMIKKILKL